MENTSRRAFLSATVATAALLGSSAPAMADIEPDHNDGPGRPIKPQKPEHDLRDILKQIDPDRIQATIMTLVGFGTRHTLSSQTDPVRGIGAATEWVYQQFQA